MEKQEVRKLNVLPQALFGLQNGEHLVKEEPAPSKKLMILPQALYDIDVEPKLGYVGK